MPISILRIAAVLVFLFTTMLAAAGMGAAFMIPAFTGLVFYSWNRVL